MLHTLLHFVRIFFNVETINVAKCNKCEIFFFYFFSKFFIFFFYFSASFIKCYCLWCFMRSLFCFGRNFAKAAFDSIVWQFLGCVKYVRFAILHCFIVFPLFSNNEKYVNKNLTKNLPPVTAIM